MKTEKSCGAIVFRREDGKIKYLTIRHIKRKGHPWRPPEGGHWDFPKGHVEGKETEKETAEREIFEESGLKVKFIDGFRETIQYISAKKMLKTVVFFLAEAESGEVTLGEDEHDAYEWLEYEDMLKKLTYDKPKMVLKKAHEFLESGKDS